MMGTLIGLVLFATIVAVLMALVKFLMKPKETLELNNLRVFKDRVRDLAIDTIEVETHSPLGRQVLDEVRSVDQAIAHKKELS